MINAVVPVQKFLDSFGDSLVRKTYGPVIITFGSYGLFNENQFVYMI